MYKTILALIFLFYSSFLCAQTNAPSKPLKNKISNFRLFKKPSTTVPENSSQNDCNCTTTPCDNTEKLLPSARNCIFNVCENPKAGYFTKLNFIYFQPKEDGFEFVAKNKVTTAAPTNSLINLDTKIISPKASWDPGFKAGLGFYIPRLCWDVFLNWTRLHSDSYKHVYEARNNVSGGLIPLFWKTGAFSDQGSPVRFSSSSSTWHFYFNTLDFEMGDSFFVSNYLSFRIHGGVKGAIIHQKLDINYGDGNDIDGASSTTIRIQSGQAKFKSDSKGLGPRIGIDSTWNIKNSDFNILTNGSIAFLLTRFDMRYHEEDRALNIDTSNDLFEEYKIHEYVWVVRPLAQLFCGLNWGCCFGKDKSFYLGCNAGYEMQYFWEQNLSRRLIDDQLEGLTYPNKGDLFLHGANISVRFEF